MTIDPIVAEVRAAREAIAKECNYDVRLISTRARERQQASGRPVVSLSSKSHNDEPIVRNSSGGDNVIDTEFEKK